jgi:hypothetical protein
MTKKEKQTILEIMRTEVMLDGQRSADQLLDTLAYFLDLKQELKQFRKENDNILNSDLYKQVEEMAGN